MNNTVKQHTQELYDPNDSEIVKEQNRMMELLYDYNSLRPHEEAQRQQLLKQMCAQIGEGCHIEPPFHANWGGKFLHLGDHVYANFNLTLVDDTDIYIGDYTLIGPNVTIAAASHPLDAQTRMTGYQFNRSVYIGKNVWLGTGVTILPGVHIGDNTVIGAGSVVTKDIPSGVLAFGTPCRVIRELKDGEQNESDIF